MLQQEGLSLGVWDFETNDREKCRVSVDLVVCTRFKKIKFSDRIMTKLEVANAKMLTSVPQTPAALCTIFRITLLSLVLAYRWPAGKYIV